MSNYVLVMDANNQPLSPCHPSVARKLLKQQKATVFRRYPFTIILNKTVENPRTESIELKLDPGSKTTGIALVQGNKVIGGLTKFNRVRLNLPKTHWLDAAYVGRIESLKILTRQPLLIQATGQGSRQMCRTDKYGFPCRYVPRYKFVKGFQTGDIVKAVVTLGKKIGTYIGRVAVRSTGSFNITSKGGIVQGISYKYCTIIHKKDGYLYAT